MQKIKVAMITDLLDRKPERTPYYRRIITELLKDPSLDITLVHYEPNPDQPLYKQVREILLPKIKLPAGSRFFAFIRFCLTSKEEFDIVHWFMPRLYPFFWLFPAKKKVVMTHGGGDVLVKESIWTWARVVFNYTLIWFNKYVDAMIGVTGYANREIIYAYGAPPEKVVTIFPAYDQMYDEVPSDDDVRKTVAKYGLEKGAYILFMGRFRAHKNVGNLVRAYIIYRQNNPDSKEKLVLAGSSKEEYVRNFGELPDSKFSADIKFVGYIQTADMPCVYAGAHSLSFVTLNEGYGMPILEAFACKVPVVTANVTAMPEVAGNAAIVVDPKNPAALAEALRLLNKPDVRAMLIERGYKRSRFFTIERSAKGWSALYYTLLDRAAPLQFDTKPLMPATLPYDMSDHI